MRHISIYRPGSKPNTLTVEHVTLKDLPAYHGEISMTCPQAFCTQCQVAYLIRLGHNHRQEGTR